MHPFAGSSSSTSSFEALGLYRTSRPPHPAGTSSPASRTRAAPVRPRARRGRCCRRGGRACPAGRRARTLMRRVRAVRKVSTALLDGCARDLDVARQHDLSSALHGSALDEVPQLAHVARPVVPVSFAVPAARTRGPSFMRAAAPPRKWRASRGCRRGGRAGREAELQDVEAVVEIGAEPLLPHQRLEIGFVAAIRSPRAVTSRCPGLVRLLLQEPQELPLGRGDSDRPRRGRACRDRPAPPAPSCSTCASVYAPRAWPNSSFSNEMIGMALQSTATNGSLRRALRKCTARAQSSFPVPVSPVISTGMSLRAKTRDVPDDVEERLDPRRPVAPAPVLQPSRSPTSAASVSPRSSGVRAGGRSRRVTGQEREIIRVRDAAAIAAESSGPHDRQDRLPDPSAARRAKNAALAFASGHADRDDQRLRPLGVSVGDRVAPIPAHGSPRRVPL